MISNQMVTQKINEFIDANAEKMSTRLMTLTGLVQQFAKNPDKVDKAKIIEELANLIASKTDKKELGTEAIGMLEQLIKSDKQRKAMIDRINKTLAINYNESTKMLRTTSYLQPLLGLRDKLEKGALDSEELAKTFEELQKDTSLKKDDANLIVDLRVLAGLPPVQELPSVVKQLIALVENHKLEKFLSKEQLEKRPYNEDTCSAIADMLHTTRSKAETKKFVDDNKEFMVGLCKHSMKAAESIIKSTTLNKKIDAKTIADILYTHRDNFYQEALSSSPNIDVILDRMITSINNFLTATNFTFETLVKDDEIKANFLKSKSLGACVNRAKVKEQAHQEAPQKERKESPKEQRKESPKEERKAEQPPQPQPHTHTPEDAHKQSIRGDRNAEANYQKVLAETAIRYCEQGVDFYKLLGGIARNASSDKIDEAYKKQLRLNIKDADLRYALNDAKAILTNPDAKAIYNMNLTAMQYGQEGTDLYKLLGVTKDASDSDIMKAEKKLQATAPDRRLSQARAILTDPNAKQVYDKHFKAHEQGFQPKGFGK